MAKSSQELSGYKALTYLVDFRRRAFESFGEAAECSDALWFATWSGGAIGGSLARALVQRKFFPVLKVLARAMFTTTIQGFFRVRPPVVHIPSGTSLTNFQVVLQSWRSLSDKASNPTPGSDRFLGTRFEQESKSKTLIYLDVLTDNVNPENLANIDGLAIGRENTVRIFHVQTLLQCLVVLLKSFPKLVRSVFSAGHPYEVLAFLVVWVSLANQRSRHSWEVYKTFAAYLKTQQNTSLPLFVLPYETHPEQNALVAAWHQAGGKTIGYIHGTMLTFPGHYLRPNLGAVDELWVHGDAYPDILRRIGWGQTTIKLTPAYRFLAMAPRPIEDGSVFFPYWSGSLDHPARLIENAVERQVLQLKHLKPHPSTGLSSAAKKTFEQLIARSGQRSQGLIKSAPSIITIGPVSVALEECERKSPFRIVHVPLTELGIDSFMQDIWEPYIKTGPYMDGDSAYTVILRKPGFFIHLNLKV